MPIKYKVVEKAQPGVAGGGIKKFYANRISNGKVTLRALAKDIASSSTVGTADVMAVLESLIEAMPKYLSDSKSVQLGDFGSFSVGISSRGEEKPESVTSNSITGNKIRFTPGKELKGFLSQVEYQKES